MKLAKLIINIVQTKTVNHFVITSFGTAVNGFLGLLFYIVVARILGPASFGILTVAVASIALISDMADLGIDTGLLRFVSKYDPQNNNKALKFIKFGLEIKLAVWLLFLLIGWFLAPLVAQRFFLKSEFLIPLRLALIGAGGAMIFSLGTHAIQAYQKFWSWNLINIGMNALRLTAIAALILTYGLNIYSTLAIYIATPFLGFFTTLFFLPNYLSVKAEQSVAVEFFHYSKWVALVGVLGAASSRLDIFISARFLTSAQVGVYSVASQLTVVIPQLIFALATVVAPKLSSFSDDRKALIYLKKLQLLICGLVLLGIVIIPAFKFLIPLIYGQSYYASTTPFVILFIAQLLFLLAMPSHQAIFYYFANPKIFTWISIGQLLITAVLGWFLVPSLGIIGAAVTILVSNFFSLIISSIWVVCSFAKKE